MTATGSGDDVAESWAAAAGLARPPLVVREPLAAFLDDSGLGAGPVAIEALGEGHSNATFLIRRADCELVLRRPPRPPIPPSAHDVVREARVMLAIADTPVPVPRVVAICTDERVVGAPFSLTERAPGVALGAEVQAGFAFERDGEAIAAELISTLVAIHAVPWQATDLADLGRPSGYLARQVRRFLGLWETNKTRDLPMVTETGDWLMANMPARSETTLVHGDFHIGNSLFTPDPPVLTAVLDWEMATLGDPLADVGYLLTQWPQAGDPASAFEARPVTRLAGFPSREELADAYARASGRAVDNLPFYMALALWKAAIFMEGNYARACAGRSNDPFALSFKEGVVEMAQRAHRIGPAGADALG